MRIVRRTLPGDMVAAAFRDRGGPIIVVDVALLNHGARDAASLAMGQLLQNPIGIVLADDLKEAENALLDLPRFIDGRHIRLAATWARRASLAAGGLLLVRVAQFFLEASGY